MSPDLAELVRTADTVLVVTPPDATIQAARDIAATAGAIGSRPLIADLNAVAPNITDAIGDLRRR